MNRLFTTPILFLLILFIPIMLKADYSGLSMGYDFNENHNDFGVGLQISSPMINRIGFRSHLCFNMYQGVKPGENSETLFRYTPIKLGIFLCNQDFYGSLRTYCELGGIMLLTNSEMTSDSKEYGMYLNFGLEFMLFESNTPVILFFEMGSNAMFTKTTANKIDGEPTYFDGFNLSVGLRYYFGINNTQQRIANN